MRQAGLHPENLAKNGIIYYNIMMLEDDYAWYYSEGTDLETRKVVNAFCRREPVTIQKWAWRYFDWLKEDQGWLMARWTRYLDLERKDYAFSEMLQYALWCSACRRMKAGKPLPDFLPPPDGWEDFKEPDDPADPIYPVN